MRRTPQWVYNCAIMRTRPARPKHATRGKAPVARAARATTDMDVRLRQALLEAALELAREGDPEAVTVRAAGLRAGVTAAVSARLFPSRAVLMGVVAAEALRRLNGEVERALASVAAGRPMDRLRAIGHAYIRWSLRNPVHFRILSDRHLISFSQVPELRDDVREVADGVSSLVADVQRSGQWPPGNTRLVVLACRALVYGLSRMKVDGQLPQWGVEEDEAETVLLDALDLYIDLLGRAARHDAGSAS